jgi:uncharacterized protein (DUF433 family)
MFKYIITNPKILGGKPIISGTRISVELILELLAAGNSMPDILKSYPHLKEAEVQEAIQYAMSQLRNNILTDIPLVA